jgi:hypothetical protein
LIWAKRLRPQWTYTNTVHLYCSTVLSDPIRTTKVRYMYIVTTHPLQPSAAVVLGTVVLGTLRDVQCLVLLTYGPCMVAVANGFVVVVAPWQHILVLIGRASDQ